VFFFFGSNVGREKNTPALTLWTYKTLP